MKPIYKAGIAVIVFDTLFLLLLPGFLRAWPTLLGTSIILVLIPTFVKDESYSRKNKVLFSIILSGLSALLMLIFYHGDFLIQQLGYYLCLCVGYFLILFIKVMYKKRNKK